MDCRTCSESSLLFQHKFTIVGQWVGGSVVDGFNETLIKTPENETKLMTNLRKKQTQIFINFQAIFSKNILEKPHLVYIDDVRYFVCTFNWLDRFRTHGRFLSRLK